MSAQKIARLLADLAAAGVELAAQGDELRFRPREAVTEAMTEQLRQHKQDLLYLLRSSRGCSAAELAVLAGVAMTAGDVPTLSAVKAAFPGATVIGFEPKPGLHTVDDLPADWREVYEERAGLMEFDGEMPRWRAERLALRDMVAWMSRTGRHECAAEAPPAEPRDTEGN